MNMGVTVGLLPTKGLTLPFVSMGGSSLVVLMLSIRSFIKYLRETDPKLNNGL